MSESCGAESDGCRNSIGVVTVVNFALFDAL
jgi:hypothetical protein